MTFLANRVLHELNPADDCSVGTCLAWLLTARIDPVELAPKMKALRAVGVPYSDEEIAKAAEEITGKTEMDAVIAYLQVLGTARKQP